MDTRMITALYERLSRDDDVEGESNSIQNQKRLLEDYAKQHGFPNPVHFTDDGISGTCFDRPGFLEMMKQVEAGRVEYLCIKDMSRLGRDYLKVGQIMEILRQKGVRLIAINDGVDSARGDDDFTPFRNIMNEYYARDTSRKIRSTFQSKGKSGKHVTGLVIYGYLWNETRDQYCEEYFVSKGMCCDIAIHDPDPPGHNPHCHIMLTMRAIDENGKWMPKSRKVYDLDENGERIKLPSGRWKSHKEDTVDWNEQYHAEEWRHGWEVIQNKYLELAGSPERVDMRSYARQGIDVIPTVHMGAAVSAMERKGIETNIGNLNRDIKSANSLMAAIRKTIKSLLEWIADVSEATKEALAEMKEQNASPTLAGLLNEYLNVRKEERRDWSRYGQNKGSLADVQAVSKAVAYLRDHNLYTLKDLDEALQEVNGRAASIRSAIKTAETRMKTITQIQKAVSVCKEHKAVKDKYLKIGWKAAQAVYAETHKDALSAFDKSFRYLKKQGLDLRVDLTALQSEFDTLEKSVAENNAKLSEVKAELQPLKDVRYWISKVIEPEQGEVEKKPEPKHSVTEKMKYLQEQKKQLEPKSPQHKQKKQNMEL